MLLIRNRIGHQAEWTPERHTQFLNACETYVNGLKTEGRLHSAQPLVREGVMVSRTEDGWKEIPFNEGNEVIVGYYHIYANGMEDAVAIAKRNPEFTFGTTARVEVRHVKTKEASTGFVYPAQ